MRVIFRLLSLLALALAWAWPAAAAQPGSGAVYCNVHATPLAFGRYAPAAGAPNDSTATVTVACFSLAPLPQPVQAAIALVSDGAAPLHQLTASAAGLRYQLYIDAARTIPWGDGNGGSAPLVVTGLASRAAPLRQQLTVYGRLLARQPGAAVGAYTSQLAITLSY